MLKIIAVAAFTLFAADSALACSVPWFRTGAGMTSNGYMTTRSGKPCAVHFRSAGPTFGVKIAQQPSHGTLRVGNIGRVIYTSKAGYVGQDSFTYVRSGETRTGRPSERISQITVTVTP
jgi:hypothetical protein